jgi:thiamine biosynthesis lipoprotein ApbE
MKGTRGSGAVDRLMSFHADDSELTRINRDAHRHL